VQLRNNRLFFMVICMKICLYKFLVVAYKRQLLSGKFNFFEYEITIKNRLAYGFTLAGRAAFETAGRYGFTPVLNKIVKKNKNSGYFVALPIPVRFGNDHPANVTIGFQFGISF
jgi:hypothetical protein